MTTTTQTPAAAGDAPSPLDPLHSSFNTNVAVAVIDPHPENPRRIDDSHPSLVGLAESIRATGLINPITVERKGNRFRILAGERRWRAAKLAGLTLLPVRVVNVTEEQAFHIINVENLQREDLHWTEEARGVEAMVKRGWDVAAIAGHLGRSEQWVRLRAKLAGIAPGWRKAVERPDSDFHGWPASMLELIARFPIETQEAMLRQTPWKLSRAQSTAELQRALDEHYLCALSAAPWALDDAKLVPAAGACSACPKRSSCQQQLFADAKADRCLDAGCWTAKAEAHVLARVATARKENPKAILVGRSFDAPKALQKTKMVDEYECRPVKAGAKGAVPAVFVTGDKAGTTGWVAPRGAAEGGSGSGSKAIKAAGAEKPATPPKQRLAEFMKRRARHRIAAIIEKLGGDPKASPYQARYAKVKQASTQVVMPDRGTLIALALSHGLPNDAQTRDWAAYRRFMVRDEVDLDSALWDDLRHRLVQVLGFDAHETDASDEGAKEIAGACGLDWTAITAAARDALPLPKTLAGHFDEDGRPLKALTTKPKTAKAKPAKSAGAKA